MSDDITTIRDSIENIKNYKSIHVKPISMELKRKNEILENVLSKIQEVYSTNIKKKQKKLKLLLSPGKALNNKSADNILFDDDNKLEFLDIKLTDLDLLSCNSNSIHTPREIEGKNIIEINKEIVLNNKENKDKEITNRKSLNNENILKKNNKNLCLSSISSKKTLKNSQIITPKTQTNSFNKIFPKVQSTRNSMIPLSSSQANINKSNKKSIAKKINEKIKNVSIKTSKPLTPNKVNKNEIMKKNNIKKDKIDLRQSIKVTKKVNKNEMIKNHS